MDVDGDSTLSLAGGAGEPAGQFAGVELIHSHCRRVGRLRLRRAAAVIGDSGEDALAQVGAELELIELRGDLGHGCAFKCEIVRADLKVHVRDHLRERAVHLHLLDAVAEVLARHALNLIRVGDELVERTVLEDPLGGGLLADLRHARQVIRRVAAQRREVRVLRRGELVLLLHRGGRKAMQRRHAAHGIENGRRVIDELQVVTVTGDDECVVVRRLRCERGHDVVGLKVLARERRNAQRLQDLTDELNLAAELLRRGLALRLVLREHLRAERLASHVESHGHGIRFLLGHDIGQHGQKSVDRVGVLAASRREVLRRQRVERAESHGVAVDEQKARRR